MLNRTLSSRLLVTGFVILSLCVLSVAANWSGLPVFDLFAPAETAVKADEAEKAPFVPTVTATVGGGGTYATLKAAFDDINAGAGGLTGAIQLDVVGDTTETVPAVLNASGVGSASYTAVLIQPTGGAARTISGAIAAGSPLIDLNGADNVTINGLNTGGNSLTISNTTAPGTTGTSTIRFIGGATNNTVTNCNLQGSKGTSVATNGAVVTFSTDAVTANGNDNNTISNNNIGPAGANLPTTGIQCNGSTTTTALGNSGLIIDNNNIFDYFGAAVTSAGIAVNGGCNTFSITNNRFYQTAPRTWTTGAEHNAILMNSATSTSGVQGMTITGNIAGYASNTQTGTYALSGAAGIFRGIRFNGISTGTVSNINNNTIANVSLTGVTSSGTSTSSPFTAILFNEGVIISNNNTIGSQSATGSLAFSTTTTSSADVYGIYNFTSNAWTANNNNIGGISVTNLGASGTFLVYGMRAFTASTTTWSATGNNVGGTVADSIQLNATGTSSQVVGMFTSNAPAALTSNTIRNLTTNIGTGTTTTASVIGISITGSTPNHTLSRNTIFNLNNTNVTAASVVTGIQFTGSTANIVERNLIYSLNAATNSTAAELNGIRIAGGTNTIRNNMIALGAGVTNAFGTGVTGGISGINEALGTNNVFHNSVYIGGSPSAGVGPSFAFNGTQTVNTRSFRDNIFYNARSNSGATGKNYVVRVGGTPPNPTGLTINNNLYYSDGSGAVFGYFNSLDVADLAGWKTAIGQDTNSFFANPQFAAAASSTPDLHLNPSIATVAEGNGSDVGVTDDYDGQTRASFTPIDIGADAGNFLGIDLAPPSISYATPGNTTLTTNRVLSVTITDVTGVATGGLAPRIYFNKNSGTYFSTACSLSSGTVQNGVWNCTVDNSLIGGVASGDVVRFFVVAQDTLGNLAANPGGGFTGTDVNTVTTPPTTPNQYAIVTAYTGSFNVGTGETYTSLTNAGGIFEAINAGALTGNVTLNLTSDLVAETGTVALNQWAEDGAGNYTLLIKPSGAPRTITGSNTGALIRLNGADRVRIDGSTAASLTDDLAGGDPALRELTIQNTNTGTSAVVINVGSGTNGAQNNTIKNVNVLGQDPTTTLAGITLGGNTPGTAGTDNDGNRVDNCSIKRAIYGIYSAGASAANQNTGTVITQNDLSATTTDRVRRVGIVVFNDDGAQITENSIAVETNESADGIGIGIGTQGVDATTVTSGAVSNALVARNKINGIASLSTTGFSAVGIAVAGGTTGPNTIVNNMITGVTSPSTSPDLVAGIYVVGVTGSSTRVYYNAVSMTGDRGAVASQMPSYGIAITGADPTVELKNNIFYTSQIASGGGVNAKSYAIGMVTTTFANLDSNYNDFWSTGANDGGFRSGSLGAAAGIDYADIAAWKAAVADDTNSLESDPLFIDPLNNLHIQASSPMIGVGTVLASVTNDFDGYTRDATPDIGADELDTTAPDTQILTNPTNPSTSSSAAFTFSGTDSAIATVASFECKLDGGAFVACTSPQNYTSLSQGSHNFQVRAIDSAGNVDPSPASYTWAVDAIAPDTQILSTPTDPSNSADATFTFSGTDSFGLPAVTFECQIDGGGFTACTSPKTYNALADGSHTFQVRAKDTAGNLDPSPASYTWLISTAPAGPVVVTATAGTPGPTSYATVKAAFDAINAGTHQGSITIAITGNTTEAASAVLNESGSGGASYTAISVQPSGGSARSISGDIAGHLIDLNGADNVTFNGLNTGGNSLTISNVSQQVTASTIRFANDATNNTVTNSTVSGSTGAALSSGFGVIYFATGTTTGNDNNTISNNNITSAGSNLPINGIYSLGTSAAIDNSGITVSGNNISDYFNANSASSGLNVNTGNSAWTITNNKFFQSATRTYLTSATHNGISVASGSGYTITGNTIGYAAANGTGVYTMGGTVTTRFVAINLAVGAAPATSVQGNTVASISVSGVGVNSGSGTLGGVSVTSGNVNIGDVTANTFGATTGTGSLTTTPTSTTAAAIVGVNSATTGTVVISNNSFGAFTSASATAANPGAVFGVNVSGVAASITVTGNTFGNTTAENMRAGVLGTTTGSSIAGGIIQTAIPAIFNYSNNTIRNFASYGTGTGGYVRGIQTNTTSSATATGAINNNTITNLTTSGAVSGQSSANSSAQGIQFLAGINTTVSGNTISNISNVNAGAVGTVVAGIVHASGTNSVISNNRIWGLSNASTTTSTTLPNVIAGIIIRSGTTTTTVVNNMISLGAGQTTNSYIFGIWGNHGSTPDPIDQVYFNSVNIEGTVASGAAPSAGFHRGDLTTTNKNPVVDVRNNIFVNTRSGGTGKHYAIANHLGGTSSTATGWNNVNNNLLNANSATIGFWTTDQTFAGWKAASGGDSLSYSGLTVNFVNAGSGDLHLNMGVTPTSLESGGVAILGFNTDFDGQTRPGPAGSTNGGAFAPDLGADEFDGVYLDGAAPIITYTSLTNTTSTANRTLSVNIIDGIGVAGGGNSPRVYYKKSTDGAYVSNSCSLAGGTPQNGSYNCLIDYSLVGGGSVATGDQLQYFVVAQDTVGNLAANPALGFSGVNVNTVTTPPTTPNTYLISVAYTGSYDVGTGQTFTSLTNTGGIFEAINNGVVTGNLTINIVSDLTGENGVVALNQTIEEGAGNYTIMIRPNGAPRTISGSSTTGIIRLNDADRITIEGSTTGGTATQVGGDAALRELTVQNTSATATAGAVIAVGPGVGGAKNVVVRNVNVLGQDPTQTLIGIHMGGSAPGSAGLDNDNNRIENCSFKRSFIAIYSVGASAANPNTGNVITMNDMSFTGADRLRRAGIFTFNQDGIQITKNSIGGIVADESADAIGIIAGVQNVTNTTATSGGIMNSLISQNKINGIASTNTTGFSTAGIAIAGDAAGPNVVANNMVTGVNSPGTSPDISAGIFVAGVTGSNTKLFFNSIAMTGDRGAVASQLGSYAIAVTGTDPTVELKDNVFYTTQTSGGGANAKSYAIGMVTTTFANLDSNYNDFVSTGANAGGFRTAGLGATGTDLATLSGWQTAVSDDANSLAVDPTFVDPLVNLHLLSGSPMVGAGTAAGGITVDFDGYTRDATPDIGADELDTTAPDTQILTNPTNPSTSSSAAFTFSGTDSAIATVASFECKLDGGAFVACTSPQNYTSLSQGSHNFQVRAIDTAGNVDPSPASYTWAVDAIAPDTQILSTPTDPSNSADATFTFSGTDSFGLPAVTFECQIDGGGFTACTSPKTYNALADGSHTFQVRAKDTAGNLDPTPASYSWMISTGPTGPVTVTASAGTATGSYPTLTDAVAAVNAGTHQGSIVISVNSSVTEPGSVVLNSSGAGSASYTSILIRPTVDGLSVAGPTVTGRGLIELNGADNVTIDGDNPNTAGINRDLTVQNTAANTVTFTSVIRVALATAVVNSADNVTIKNLNILGSATGRNLAAATSTTGTENTTFGIIAGTGASTVTATAAPAAITSVSTSAGAGATASNLAITNNSFGTAGRGITVNGSATTVFPGLLVNNNTIGNPAAGAADQIYSIGITAQGSANGIISGNTVRVEGYLGSSSATHAINVGVNSATGTFTIDSNRVERARNNNGATWSAMGINLGGGSSHIVQNNFVSGVMNDQTAGTGGFGTTFGAYGIRIASGTGHKVYHNSVNIYGAIGGATSTDVTAAFVMTSTAQTGVDVRNNIFANTATGGNAAGTRHVAVMLPSSATSAMNLTDNNNAYFVGSDANNRLAQVGTTFGTGEYQASAFDPTSTTPAANFRAYTNTLSAAGTNDNASFASTAPPPFTSSSNLHIPNATATPLESAGAAVGLFTDIDGETRPNGTAPDIGADEFAGTPPPANDIAANTIVTPVNGSTIGTGNAPVPQASFTNVGSATQTNVGVQFTIAGPGGYAYSNSQTIATIAPFQTVTVTFAAAPALTSAGGYTTSAAVTTPDTNSGNNTVNGTFQAQVPLSGTVSVGSAGDFTSLTNPGGLFENLNLLGTGGNLVVNITSDLTTETGAVPLNQIAGGFNLTIKPSGGARTISGNGSALGMIRLFGADNVTIDGSLSGGTDRSLTITYGNTGGTVIWIGSAGAANGATGNIIKNCIISGNTGTTIVGGILSGSGTTLGGDAEAANSNNRIENNWIYRVQNGAYLRGGTASPAFDQNWIVGGNEFGSSVTADKNSFRGMLIGNAQNFTIQGNLVHGIRSTASTTAAMSGIQLALLVDGGSVSGNNIYDIKNVSSSGTGAFGMQISATSAAANVTIANNFISDVAALGSATVLSNGHGINFNGTGAGGYKVYHNSVNLNTDQASGTTAALHVGSTVTAAGALDVRNNIFANTQTTGATRYAVYSAAAATVFTPINYNDYFAANVGFIGGSARVTLGDWQTATTQDANSLAVDPLFVSAGDLHLQAGSTMIDAAPVLAGATTDYDGQTRPIGTSADIGADERASQVAVSGRILTSDGQGIKNVVVSISDGSMNPPRWTLTGPFGYYSFDGLVTGQTYTISLQSKRFTFTPGSRIVTPYADITDFGFVADPLP